MRTVAGKTEEQQAMLALHRIRMSADEVSYYAGQSVEAGCCYEFGITLKGGRQAGFAEMQHRMAELEQTVPGMLFNSVKEST